MVLLSLLTACGGSDSSEDSRFGGQDKTQDDTVVDDVNDDEPGDIILGDTELTNVSFLPLMTMERHKDWYDGTQEGVLLSYGKGPYIPYYTINPINATTLEPITTAKASDFSIVEDDIPLNPKVNFPTLQKVLGNSVKLSTALVINTSSSMDSVDKAAFIQEIKNFVSLAKASNTSFMSEQAFTVWGYDGDAVEETGGFKYDTTSIHAALDGVLNQWTVSGYRHNTGSNYTYDAVVEAIGRYVGDGAFSVTGDSLAFKDSFSGDQNDLEDDITPDLIKASSIIVFSAGFSSTNRFDEEFVVKALESQSTFVYEEGVVPSGAATETKALPKTFVYVVPDGEPVDEILEANATSVIKTSISGGKYSFSSGVLDAVETNIKIKTGLNNQHVLRWASSLRAGKGHTRQIKTRTDDGKFGYAITTDNLDFDPAVSVGMPMPSVEITGANNEYLSAGTTDNFGYNTAVAYANEITRFYPATRWTNQIFSNSDYTWTSNPSNAFTLNTDGSVSVNTALLPVTLGLTNSNINYEGGTITDNFTLTIFSSK